MCGCARSLAQFPTLRNLELHMTGLTDEGLAALAPLPLEVLWLGPRITDDGVRELAGLGELEVLWLTRSRITDASIGVLSRLTGLRELNVNYTEITAAGLAELRRARRT